MKAIFILAHPDDECFLGGGIIAKLTKSGSIVKIITATKGEEGQVGTPPACTKEKLGECRELELKNAAKVLGISQIYFLGYRDGTLAKITKNEIADKILKILEKEKPDMVFTFNEEGASKHPDHIQIHKTATLAFLSYCDKAKKHVKLYYGAMPRSLIKKLNKEGIMYSAYGKIEGTEDSKITTVIDISDTANLKVKALMCHKTQNKDWERFLKRKNLKEFKKEYFKLIKENNII